MHSRPRIWVLSEVCATPRKKVIDIKKMVTFTFSYFFTNSRIPRTFCLEVAGNKSQTILRIRWRLFFILTKSKKSEFGSQKCLLQKWMKIDTPWKKPKGGGVLQGRNCWSPNISVVDPSLENPSKPKKKRRKRIFSPRASAIHD